MNLPRKFVLPLLMLPLLCISAQAAPQPPALSPDIAAQPLQEALSELAQLSLDIAAQPLQEALSELAQKAKLQLIFYSQVGKDAMAPRVAGTLTPQVAFSRMLAGTGLRYEYLDQETVAILGPDVGAAPRNSGEPVSRATYPLRLVQGETRTAEAQATRETPRPATGKKEAASDSSDESTVVVTGGRLISDPGKLTRQIEVFDRKEIERSGVTRLDEFLERLPQNVNPPTNMGSGDYTRHDFGLGTNAFAGSGVNLRGLGSQYTLVLIDGRRPAKGGQFGEIADISNIPISQVERIEILFDGAAALYGADAVGGVLNIITSKEYDGTEATLAYEETQKGGGQRSNMSLSRTLRWGNTSLTATVGYQGQRTIGAQSRPELNFINGRQFNVPPATPGNIISSSSTDPLFYVADHNRDGDTLDPGERITGTVPRATAPGALPAFDPRSRNPGANLVPVNGVPWTGVFQAELPAPVQGQKLTLYDVGDGGAVRGFDYQPGIGFSLTPEDETYSTRLTFRHEISSALRVQLNTSYSMTDKSSNTNNTLQEFSVSAANPDNPFQTSLRYAFAVPLQGQRQQVEQWNGSLSGSVEYDFRPNWALSAGFGQTIGNNVSDTYDRLNDNLRTIALGYRTIFTSPRTYEFFNGVFDPLFGYASEAALRDALTYPLTSATNKTVSTDLDVNVDGTLARLPAGDMRVHFSLSRQEQKTHSTNTNTSLYATVIASPNGYYGYTSTWDRRFRGSSTGLGVQLLAPLVSREMAVPLVQNLLLNVNARAEEYGTVDERGGNWSAGFNWQLTDWLTARVNRTSSLLIPASVRYSGDPSLRPGTLYVFDEDRETLIDSFADYTLTGGANHLDPERNTGTTVGFILTPRFLKGLNLQVNLTESKTRDQVGVPFMDRNWIQGELTPEAIALNPVLSYMTPELAALSNLQYGVDWNDDTLVEDYRDYNVGNSLNRGADFSLRYTVSSRFGDWFATWRHQYLDTNDVVVSAICPPGACSEAVHSGSGTSPSTPHSTIGVIDRREAGYRFYPLPRNSGMLDLTWSFRGLGVNANWHYRDSTAVITSQKMSFFEPETNVYKLITRPPESIDMNISYDFTGGLISLPRYVRGLRVRLGIQDLWSRKQKVYREVLVRQFEPAPLSAISSFNGLDARGRTYSLSITGSF